MSVELTAATLPPSSAFGSSSVPFHRLLQNPDRVWRPALCPRDTSPIAFHNLLSPFFFFSSLLERLLALPGLHTDFPMFERQTFCSIANFFASLVLSLFPSASTPLRGSTPWEL